MRILSHLVSKHNPEALLTKTEVNGGDNPNSRRQKVAEQAEEIQNHLTAKLEEELEQK